MTNEEILADLELIRRSVYSAAAVEAADRLVGSYSAIS